MLHCGDNALWAVLLTHSPAYIRPLCPTEKLKGAFVRPQDTVPLFDRPVSMFASERQPLALLSYRISSMIVLLASSAQTLPHAVFPLSGRLGSSTPRFVNNCLTVTRRNTVCSCAQSSADIAVPLLDQYHTFALRGITEP